MTESNDGPATRPTLAPSSLMGREDSPNAKRRGWLKHGNAPGDFHKCARCGAKTRKGTACKSPAMRNGRCRMHGGTSTGPRTWEGRKKCAETQTVHGRCSKGHLEQKRAIRLASRANEIAVDLSIHRLHEINEQIGYEIPDVGEDGAGLPAKLSPSIVEKKTVQSQRLLEKLWEIPSFRLLRSVRQARRFRKHLRQTEQDRERSKQLIEQRIDTNPAEEFEKTRKQLLQRAESGGAISMMTAHEAIATVRSKRTRTGKPLSAEQGLGDSSGDPQT